MKKWLLIFLLALCSTSNAAFMTGNDLYIKYLSYVRTDNKQASNQDYVTAYDYLGFVTGVWDTLGSNAICANGEVTRGQIADIVGRGLQNHPESRGQNGSQLVAYYLISAFPCSK